MRRTGLILTLALLAYGKGHAEVRFIWKDAFSGAEQEKLRTWVEDTVAGVEQLVGPFPFDIHVHMHRADRGREPVPWANTRRGAKQGVNFHVNTRYSLEAFRADWTAPHELSHLIIPYLGSKHSWFAEGFASYMQYQVMQATKALTAKEASHRYLARLDNASRNYRFDDRAFAHAAPTLKQERKYPVMYWGGAAYFLQVDAALRSRGNTRLIDVLGEYLECCRRNSQQLDSLVAELDGISGTGTFSKHLARFRTEPGFPRYDVLSEYPAQRP